MGLYTIITRAAGTVLTGQGSSSNIFNVDHQNHVTHTAAAFLNSWEDSLLHMNLETDPYPGGAISLPAALSDEFERIRFVLSDLKRVMASGTKPAHWYTESATFSTFVSFPLVAARMELNGVQQIPSGSLFGQVYFDTTLYASTGMIPGTEAPGTLTAPATGIYLVGACVGIGDGLSTGPSGDMQVSLRRGNAGFTTSASAILAAEAIAVDEVYSGATAMPKIITVETIAKFTASQACAAYVFQNSGALQTLQTNSTFRPALWMALLGRLSS